MQQERYAYLIMAHNQFSILIKLLEDLDNEKNDIYLHIDYKAKSVPIDEIKRSVLKARLFLVQRMRIGWGGYSQIECELHLIENALKNGPYLYYHFLCGTEFPLKSQATIQKFFREHRGLEFIEYDMLDNEYEKRIRYYHFFNECGRPTNIFMFAGNMIREWMLKLQKRMGVDLRKRYKIVFMKGNANWSITDKLANEVLKNRETIRKIYRHSFCADEVFLHTLVYNSSFFERVYRNQKGDTSNMRKQQWNRSDNCYYMEDLDELLRGPELYARKFSGLQGVKAIEMILMCRELEN